MFPTPEIFTRLNGLIGEAIGWGPAIAAAILFVIALVQALVLPGRPWAKGVWALAIVLCGVVAGILLRWDQHRGHSAAVTRVAAETAALHGVWSQWDTLAKTLPAPANAAPEPNFDTVDDAIASLSTRVASVGEQIAALKSGAVGRSIEPDVAAKLADYLRQYGYFRVVVSCIPDDTEAFTYANQLVGLLKAAGWDANGPERTVNVLEGPAMGVTVLVRDPTQPDAAKILIAAFDQFNIPHQPGISPDNAIPDTATVELIVARKP